MKKITELTETRRRTTYYRDAYGNRERGWEEFEAYRPVKSVSQGPRIGHFVIDYIVYAIILSAINLIIGLFKLASHSPVVDLTADFWEGIISLLLYPAYYFFCEYTWQRTLGKLITKTVVIDEYGNKPDVKAIILRSIIRIIPFEPFSCFADKYSHGWHDRWSKTWVVPEDELAELKRLQQEQSVL